MQIFKFKMQFSLSAPTKFFLDSYLFPVIRCNFLVERLTLDLSIELFRIRYVYLEGADENPHLNRLEFIYVRRYVL